MSGECAHIVPSPNENSDPSLMVNNLIDCEKGCWNIKLIKEVLEHEDALLVANSRLSPYLSDDSTFCGQLLMVYTT